MSSCYTITDLSNTLCDMILQIIVLETDVKFLNYFIRHSLTYSHKLSRALSGYRLATFHIYAEHVLHSLPGNL